MKKLWVIAAAAGLFFSCKLIPEIEGEYPGPRQPELSSREGSLFGRSGPRDSGEGSGPDPGESGQGAGGPGGEEASVNLPLESPAREQGEPELPDPVLDLAEADYPGDPPGEDAGPALSAATIAAPARTTTPAQLPASTGSSASAAAPRTAPRQPPAPPAAIRPSRPAPSPQEREDPAAAIPDMPFQSVSVLPPEDAEPNYSRTVRALRGQYIEIPFRGPGWIYLGELGSRRGVSFDSRRSDSEGMIFAFRADAEGTYSLKFNRQDFIHDIVLNDYVKVIVEAPPGTTGSPWSNPREMPSRIYAAPRWPPSPELSGDPGGEIPPSGIPAAGEDLSADRIPQPAAPGRAPPEQAAVSGMQIPEPGRAPPEPAAALGMQIPETAPPVSGDWIRRAREEYDGGRIASALAALDQFMLYYPGGSDEAYWLYGQFLEANNDATRDIRRALDYYRRLVQEYPQSSRYEEARRRIAYLERFYFNIQ